jgi:NAD(P)-dependent dehydrogenase (short-subunit alcohol dehydrogenase family)
MTSNTLSHQTIAVFGASSGIGLAVARGAHASGARVIAIGRDRARLAAAVGTDAIQVAQCDIADETQVAALLRDIGALNHVVVTAGGVVGASPLTALDFDTARELAPLRVYGVSPGPVDTPNWGPLSEDARRERAARLATTLPVGFMASADDTAQAYLFAMQARALTGTVIDLDSGAQVGG